MSYYVQGKKYVGHSRDNLIDQINSIRARFRTYTDYANATFEETFLPEELEGAFVVCSERFESSYLQNLGKGKFKVTSLPLITQISTINGMVAEDYDDDGNLDVLVVGNSYAPEISSGRDDASIGFLLKGDGKGGLTPLSVQNIGFLADRDAKGLVKLLLEDGRELIIVGNNDSPMQTYVTRKPAQYYRAGEKDAYALMTLKSGQIRKQEFYYGSTYLSHSSRSVKLPLGVVEIKVGDSKGEVRAIKDNLNP